MLRARTITTLILGGSLTGAAIAGPTGLYVIPIADVLGHRECSYGYTLSGNEKGVDPRYYHAHGLEVGLFDRMELGFDNDFQGSTSYNFKLLVLDDPKHARYALSVGGTGFGDGMTPGTFVAARYNFGEHRLHAGYWQAGDNRFVVGMDGPLVGMGKWCHGASYSAERLWGEGASTTLAVYFPVKGVSGLSAGIGLTVPDDRASGVQHSVALTYGFKF